MKKLFQLIFLTCFFIKNANSQVTFVVKIIDNTSQVPIQNAEISVSSKIRTEKKKSDKNGVVSFALTSNEKISYKISKESYFTETGEINMEAIDIKDYPYVLLVSMNQKTKNLSPVNVYAPGMPRIVYQSKEMSVSDFEFLENDELLLLLYPKTLKKGSELAVFKNGNVQKSFKLPENPIELIHDFKGNPQVVCEKGVYGIHRTENELGISNIEKNYFLKYVLPIVDTSFSKYYFSNFNKNYPAFDYKTFDKYDSSYSVITEIKDDLMMELYRSEIKWVDVRVKLWAKNLELETGIDKEIWVGANYFTQSIYYKELYAPMFKKNDTVFVFDYYKELLFSFDLQGKKVDSVSINHHQNPKENGWKRKLIQDKTTGRIFAFFEKDGICSLKEIDTKTGKLVTTTNLKHKYIDKIAVKANIAYYIYRPFESAQKKYLYQVDL